MRNCWWKLWAISIFTSAVLAQDESNIGRTEADDDYEEPAAAAQLGRLGPVVIPLKVDADCVATVALYTPQGRLVRILGQVIPLRKGEHSIRWDGLDLFGNVVPAETPLEVKLITNQPLRAFYEFSVSAPKVAPWGGNFDGKAGGWLADHSAPNSLTAIGDKLLIGSFLAEHGNNLIGVNLKGEKLWGLNLAGWTGPAALANDGRFAYALMRNRDSIVRVDPEQKERPNSRQPVYASPEDKVQAFAARDDKFYLVKRNHRFGESPFGVALGNGRIDFTKSRPQVLDNTAPTEFMIGAQTAWGNTFTSAGNPQNGATMVLKNSEAFALVVFKEPVAVGTVVLGRIAGADKAYVYTLQNDLAYDEKYSPLNAGEDDALGGLNLMEFRREWTLLGETGMAAPVNLLPAARAGLTTRALLIRAVPAEGMARDWRPRLQMARIMKERFTAVAAQPGWSQRTEAPVSEIYPVETVVNLGRPAAVDGVLLLNCVNPDVFVDARAGADWVEVGRYRGKYDKKLGYLSASKASNEQFVHFPERVTTSALRFRHHAGYRGGKWGAGKDDSYRVETDFVMPVRLVAERDRQPTHVFEVFDVAGQKSAGQWAGNEYDIPALAFAPNGTLFSVVSNRLCRTEVTAAGLRHQPVGEFTFTKPWCLAASADRLAVGDQGRHAVFVFDHAGKRLATIGDKGPRARGPWNPDVVERPSAVAFAADGTIWVAEELFAPKRVARYAADGKFIEEFLGPPMYGGGGYLAADLKSFYYRSMEFALDWEKGTSRLQNLNDRLRSEETPVQHNNSFAYTGIGRPVEAGGRRYITGENSISILEGNTWRPCVVMGDANNSHFLLGKESWKRHWARLELTDKLFIWCDHNGDGKYQVEEVELIEASSKPDLLRGLTVAPDLSLWGSKWRARPSQVTAAGVPIFRAADFESFDYDALAPHYNRNYTLGGPRSAKPGYSGFKYVSQAGALYQEGQPFVVLRDGTIKGGAPTTKPSDYVPLIDGLVPQQTFLVCGGAPTKSAVGEVVVVNSNLGYWYVWAVDYGVCIGTFFTGATGGWGWGMPVQRGLDVTGRKHEWEGWGGHFLRADNGQYYATGGKGFHGISRVEGLDNFQVQTFPLRVTPEQAKQATQLRPVLKGRHDAVRAANAKDSRKELLATELAKRTKNFKLDGELEDWGPRHQFQVIGAEKEKLVFDVAHDERGLYLAFSGDGKLVGGGGDWKQSFRAGFAFDLQFRTDPKARARDAVAGDRRLVISRHGADWIGVLYEYEVAGQDLVFDSPVGTSRIARVVKLPADALRVRVKEDQLGLDISTLDDALEGVGEAPTMPGGPKPKTPKAVGRPWTAELFVPWTTLGLTAENQYRFDVGLNLPGPTGALERSLYWSNRYSPPLGDAALETLLNPGAWGTLRFR